MSSNNLSKNWPIIFAFIILLLVYAYLFKFTGIRFIFTVLIFILPSYLILNLFELDEPEKIVFSFFVSISIISSSVYWLAFVTKSIRMAFLLAVFLILASVFILTALKTKKLFLFKEKHKP